MSDRVPQSAAEEIAWLTRVLQEYQHQYYVEASPTVSDLSYDRLMDRLICLEREHPDLMAPDSPSQRVGSDLSADFPEIRHTVPVLSLDKAYSSQEILQWIQKSGDRFDADLSFVVEEKIDGVSMVLYYEQGVLVRAVTRGNGAVGNDVTANIRTIGSVPLRLGRPLTIAVRGEVFLPKDDFATLNAQQEVPFANPRNLAAGTVRRIKSSETARVPLTIFVYEGLWNTSDTSGAQSTNHLGILRTLVDLGFRVNPSVGVFARTAVIAAEKAGKSGLPGVFTGSYADIPAYIEEMTRRRKTLGYEIDGLVVKVNELELREAFGYTGHHPRWAIAYKFEAPQAETTVLGIDVQVGRTGRITPVARVESVPIGGSVVSNITLHNQDYIDLLELAIGDTVAISKRGDVIPAVERVLEKNNGGNTTWRMPLVCPCCQTFLVSKGAHTFCPNPTCPDQVAARISFFVGKGQMDIEGLGPETVLALIEKGWLEDLPDIYAIDYTWLIGEKGFGAKKVEALIQGVAKSKTRPYRNVLVSLGIPEFGHKAVDLLVSAGIYSVDALLDLVDRDDRGTLLAIKGFGEKTVTSLFDNLRDSGMRERIRLLRQTGLNFSEEPVSATAVLPQVFSGQTWCVTGSFIHYTPRSLAMAEIEKRGGRTTSSVTGKTTHLLAGTSAGGKLGQAQAFGVRIVDEEEFMKMLVLAEKE